MKILEYMLQNADKFGIDYRFDELIEEKHCDISQCEIIFLRIWDGFTETVR